MATIGKIRERSGLVIGMIGLAMLGFIATDLFSRNSLFNGRSGPAGIGKIYGEDIDPSSFQQRYEKALNNQRQQLPPEASMTSAMEGAINDQVWQQMLSEKILGEETHDLGLDVSGEEIMDLCVGANPHPIAMQYLADRQTGQMNKQEIYRFITTIQDNPNPEAKAFWADFEDYLSEERLKEKYFGMIKSAMYVTDLEAKKDFEGRNNSASIQFVPLFFNAVSDSSVKVTDADIEKYYNQNKEEYKREDGRTLEYVTFDIAATKEDTIAAEKWINQQVEPFRKAKNDSNYVVRIGRTPFKNQFLPRGSYPASIEDQIFSSDSGTIIGPFFENGTYKLAKVIAVKNDSLNYFKASHILIRPNGGTAQDSTDAYNKAKEIYNKIKAGADFNQMAIDNSQDQSNASKGGDLGWFREGQMVSKFDKAVKNAKKGDLLLVQTEFGTHIIKVTENKSNKIVKAAVIERPVGAGKATQDNAYAQASKFRSMATSGAEFEAAVNKMHLTKRLAENIKPNERNIAGLENPRELIRWAYATDTKVGDVSEPKVIGSKYVVAHLTKSYQEGYAPLEEIKDQVKVFAIREKKKEMLTEKMEKAMEGANSFEAIAKNLQSSVNSAENVTFQNSFVQNLTNEPALVGTVFGLKENKISKPVKGENGVYIVKVVKFNTIKAPEKFDMERKVMMQQQGGNVQGAAMDALRKKADVKDTRYLYY